LTSGILNVNKPKGPTSFDVVARVRKATGVRRAGHAGTLDPLATGVLLVGLGQATRIMSYLQDAPKVYLAGIKFGERTDTYDAEGHVVKRVPVPDKPPTEAFIGDIWQTPPMFSALKHEGRPLYDYARRGETVERQPRRVHVESIELVDWQSPLATLRVKCGKGTYIRSLANDMGGHLVSLAREAVGGFRIEDALALDQLSSWENWLMPIGAALPQLRRLAVDAGEAARLVNGQRLAGPAGEALALAPDGRAVAILRDGQPEIVFGTE
jgi:tRNA pseudouridine55 synthase